MISVDGRKAWPGTLNLADARELDNSYMSHGAFMSQHGSQGLQELSKPMKAISLWQPWATLMALNFKKVETRIWDTKHRGPLAIHAAAKIPFSFLGASRYSLEFQEECASVFGCSLKDLPQVVNGLPRGAVLCIVDLQHIESAAAVKYDIPLRERIFGNYDDGCYAWFTELLEVMKEPIKAKGNRRLWNWQRS